MENDLPDPQLAFDMAALQAALQRKAPEADCPFCGENVWGIPDGTAVIAGVIRPDGTIDDGVGLQVLALICTTCGFVRMHDVEQLSG